MPTPHTRPGVLRTWLVLGLGCGAAGVSVARPALRLGGEWAGHCVSYSADGALRPVPEQYVPDELLEWGEAPRGFEALTTETWDSSTSAGGGPSVLNRRTVKLLPEDGCNCENLGALVSHATLPTACSGSAVLRPGNAMFESDVLNARAWALDAVDPDGGRLWRLETLFDGLGGGRPRERSGARECPKERTRVQCTFDPSSGTLAAREPVVVWQERCWSAGPSDELTLRDSGRTGLDASWVASVVGIECFGDEKRAAAATQTATAAADGSSGGGGDAGGASGDDEATTRTVFGGGIELRAQPGLLEITLRSGAGDRNSWSRVVMRRSWAGDEGGRSVFSEVDTFDETEGDD